MKRVTILVDDIGEPDDFDDERLLYGARPWSPDPHIYVAASRVISVEDHVEPLPTEPGTRFWGQLGDAEPQWWFVRQLCIGGRTHYMPGRGTSLFADDARAQGLVRLPDPKPAEADGAR